MFTSDAGAPVLLALAFVSFLAVVLLIVIWSIRRHRAPSLKIECDAPISEQMRALAGLTNSAVYAGNSVELLENGAFFDVLFEEIKAAKQSVHFETFLWKEGVLGAETHRCAARAPARRRRGARAWSMATAARRWGDDVERRLLAAGCKFVLHHRKQLRNIGVFNDRDHRKLVVLDGRVALVCGHCIVDAWLGDAQSSDHVRDLGVQVARARRARRAGGLQRELGGGYRRAVRRRRRFSRLAARGQAWTFTSPASSPRDRRRRSRSCITS